MHHPARPTTLRPPPARSAVRPVLLLLLLAAGGAVRGAAQQARIELGVDPRDIFVDQPFAADVVVDYVKEYAEPRLPDIADCDEQLLGTGPTSSMTSIINGQYSQRNTIRFRYALTPRRLGRFEIPSFEVTIDGRPVRAPRVSFEARKEDSAMLMTARVSCDAAQLYVGQQARFTLEIWVKAPELTRRAERQVMGTQRLDAEETWRFVDSRNLAPFKTALNMRTEMKKSGDAGTTERWYVYTLADTLTVTQPGPLRFSELLVQMRYPLEANMDPFGMLGGSVSRARNLAVMPSYDELEVRPLPTEGRPADFSGAVGRYSIATSVSPAEARVGDPIELTIDLRGDGAIDALPPPKLDANRSLTAAFRLPDAALAGETIGGDARSAVRRYKVALRASRPLDELPPISYSYFDPSVGQYATAVAGAKPLRVRAAEKVDAAEVVGLAAPSGEPPKADVAPLDGLQPNRTDDAALLAAPHRVGLAGTLAAAIGPPLLCAAATVFRAVRARRGGAAERRRSALHAAAGRIRAAHARPPRELAAEVHAALAGYLADRLNEPIGRYAGRAGVDLLNRRGLSAATVNRWARLIETTEAASFGGLGGTDAARLVDEAQQLLAATQREGL